MFLLGVAATTVCAVLVALAWSATSAQRSTPPGRDAHSVSDDERGEDKANAHWLSSDWDDARDKAERHFRGLDVAMVEIGYRFKELHLAGVDRNWPYALYQVEKIELALALALDRRPKRARSAGPFLRETIPYVKQAIDAAAKGKGTEPFADVVGRMRVGCMKCHVLEKVPHFTVYLNDTRTSVIGTGEPSGHSR